MIDHLRKVLIIGVEKQLSDELRNRKHNRKAQKCFKTYEKKKHSVKMR